MVRTAHQETIPRRLELPQRAADTETLINRLAALVVLAVQAAVRLTVLLEVLVSQGKVITAGMVLMDTLMLVVVAGQVQPEVLEVLAGPVYQVLSLERRRITLEVEVREVAVEARLLLVVLEVEEMAMAAMERQILVVAALAGPLVAGLGARADPASSSSATLNNPNHGSCRGTFYGFRGGVSR